MKNLFKGIIIILMTIWFIIAAFFKFIWELKKEKMFNKVIIDYNSYRHPSDNSNLITFYKKPKNYSKITFGGVNQLKLLIGWVQLKLEPLLINY